MHCRKQHLPPLRLLTIIIYTCIALFYYDDDGIRCIPDDEYKHDFAPQHAEKVSPGDGIRRGGVVLCIAVNSYFQ